MSKRWWHGNTGLQALCPDRNQDETAFSAKISNRKIRKKTKIAVNIPLIIVNGPVGATQKPKATKPYGEFPVGNTY